VQVTNTWQDAATTPTLHVCNVYTLGYSNIKFLQNNVHLLQLLQEISHLLCCRWWRLSILDRCTRYASSNWTQGVLNNVQLPSDCDNATSVEIVWYKTSNVAGQEQQ